jgi:GTP cyclohydrolase IB
MLPDTQSLPDTRDLPIDRVGIRRLRYPVQIREKNGGHQPTVAFFTMTVDLPAQEKGTHMSRFIEALQTQGAQLDITAVAGLPQELRRRLHSRSAHVQATFPFFIKKRAPVSGAEGLLDSEVTLDVEATGDTTDLTVTVEVPVATLCPCSKAISAYGAHNQRGLVRLTVKFRRPVWIEDLIRLVEDSASCELYSVLKRPDEKAVTERAYDNPTFVEDVVRNVGIRCRDHADIAWYRVEVENFESIHNHNAFAVIEGR